jgi:hypothetical protein
MISMYVHTVRTRVRVAEACPQKAGLRVVLPYVHPQHVSSLTYLNSELRDYESLLRTKPADAAITRC